MPCPFLAISCLVSAFESIGLFKSWPLKVLIRSFLHLETSSLGLVNHFQSLFLRFKCKAFGENAKKKNNGPDVFEINERSSWNSCFSYIVELFFMVRHPVLPNRPCNLP